ncbi:MAG: hypothetical protein K0R24_128 [Gammaproteobacteria bacterium]|jgi:hypothetical protein|nr:hypothetical protein [Gammaproteobacteria bacterium]
MKAHSVSKGLDPVEALKDALNKNLGIKEVSTEFNNALEALYAKKNEPRPQNLRSLLTPEQTKSCFELLVERFIDAPSDQEESILKEIVALFHENDGLENSKKEGYIKALVELYNKKQDYRQAYHYLLLAKQLKIISPALESYSLVVSQPIIESNNKAIEKILTEMKSGKSLTWKQDLLKVIGDKQNYLLFDIESFNQLKSSLKDLKNADDRVAILESMVQIGQILKLPEAARPAFDLAEALPKKTEDEKKRARMHFQTAFDLSDDISLKLKALENLFLLQADKKMRENNIDKLITLMAKETYKEDQHKAVLNAVKNSHLRRSIATRFSESPELKSKLQNKNNLLVKMLETHTNRFTLFFKTGSHKILDKARKNLNQASRSRQHRR